MFIAWSNEMGSSFVHVSFSLDVSPVLLFLTPPDCPPAFSISERSLQRHVKLFFFFFFFHFFVIVEPGPASVARDKRRVAADPQRADSTTHDHHRS